MVIGTRIHGSTGAFEGLGLELDASSSQGLADIENLSRAVNSN
jgi:hypothetical protein